MAQQFSHHRPNLRRVASLVLLCIACVLLLQVGGAMAAAPRVVTTTTFQNGLNDYAGTRDTWVSDLDWDTPPQHTVNYGQNEELTLSRDGSDNPLLRFDVTSIPSNSAVLTATLMLYNTTPARCNTAGTAVRRVDAFRVLRDWDEGNQIASPINASGKHGATGNHAFDYFTGQGTDLAWTTRGMAAGADFAATAETHADVVNEGWYAWNVTALVRAWVRGEQPNFGLVLRDASGYADDNCDWRAFVSSQNSNASNRPKLVVVYNPSTPWANAGPDQTNFTWNSSALTLDGSASHDRPGGNDNTLTFSWRVVDAAYGSSLGGATLGTAKLINFTPDVPGEWEIELTVTNSLGESATDRVHLRVLKLAAAHPRILLTPAKLATLQARAVPSNPRWTQLLAEANDPNGEMHAHALVSQITGQASYCNQAIAQAEALIATNPTYSTSAGDVALVYDWCYARLNAGQRTAFVDFFNAWGDTPHGNDISGWGNYWPRFGYSFALMGIATFGDNPRAAEWLDEFRYLRFRDIDLPLLNRIADGGAWPEGMIYDWIANLSRVKAIEAWRTATGENLFGSTAWFRNRLGYILLHRWPGTADQFGFLFHPYVSTGDTERNRGSIGNYERIMALMLIERFPTEPLAAQLQAYLSAPPTDNSMSFLYHDEFLWFNPAQLTTPPTLLTHVARDTGTIFMRSGWPSGAADTDTSATMATFQSGDHFTYHQHYDQNSFTLFKHSDLAIDSGVYSGDGLSNHDINYYVRTLAHNTLVVYNASEDFSSARPDATANDGGQRTMSPASRSPENIDDFDQHALQYDTGDLTRFTDDTRFTYALGDATKAYNNPTYNQAMNTGLVNNVAKVSRFQREFVYLRPMNNATSDYVVLFDRVGVTQAAFSGANTKLLFHTVGEPNVTGAGTSVSAGETLYAGANFATATNGDGKLFIKTLLPAARNLRKVGGRGVKAFWVNGANYDWHWGANETQPRPVNDFEDVPYGEWRLEFEPGDTALNHNFLTVLHPAPASQAAMPTTTLINGTGLSGAHIADASTNRVALFSAANDGQPVAGTLQYSYAPTARTLHTLFNLPAGTRYNVTAANNSGVVTVQLTPAAQGARKANDQGVLAFSIGMAGAVCPASDFNDDGSVTATDVQASATQWAQPLTASNTRYDLNDDAVLDIEDVMKAAASWGSGC